jgi:hypothetical protein
MTLPTSHSFAAELRVLLAAVDPATLTRADIRALIDVLQEAVKAIGVE